MFSRCILGTIPHIRSPSSFKCATQMRFTSDSAYFCIHQDNHKDYAILKMNRAPVNSFDLEFVTDLSYQLDIFEKRKDLNGVILTSVRQLSIIKIELKNLNSIFINIKKGYFTLFFIWYRYYAALSIKTCSLGKVMAWYSTSMEKTLPE